MWKVQLFKLNFDGREADAVRRVVESGWLTMGEETASFESAFSEYLGGVNCIAVANGTAALHMALLALEVGVDDEVIIPALTFVADANAVRLVGAKPVLADCGSADNWNLTAESIERRITSRTKAVIIVHYAGFPCDMPAISRMCKERGLKLIEDVAHAPGASIAGKKCGAWGEIGCFSFFSNKNLSIGEGGMVSTCDTDLSHRLRYLRSHGMSTLTLDRHKGRAISYDVVQPGLNYRMDEMRAAIGLVQLDKLEVGNQRRKVLTERYRENLSGSLVNMPFAKLVPGTISAYHILPTLLPAGTDRAAVIKRMKDKGVQASIHYPPFWNFSAYAGQFKSSDAPQVAGICEHQLTLPLFPTMTEDSVDLVTETLLGSL